MHRIIQNTKYTKMQVQTLRVCCLLVLSFFLHTISSAQQPIVQAKLDSNHILIGDQLGLHLEAHLPNGFTISPPDLRAFDTLESIEIIDLQPPKTADKSNGQLVTQDLIITAFDSGTVRVPAITYSYQGNGKSGTISTNDLLLEVSTVIADSLGLAPLKPYIHEPMTLQDVLPIILAIGGLIVVGILIWWWIKRRKKAEIPPPPPVMIPVHRIALEQLSELKEKELWQKGEVKAYQSELTHIVREYLENRYHIQALESTTDEITRELHRKDVSKAHQEQLTQMLQMADLVKFAKAKPSIDIHDQVWEAARQFVEDTKDEAVAIEETKLQA